MERAMPGEGHGLEKAITHVEGSYCKKSVTPKGKKVKQRR